MATTTTTSPAAALAAPGYRIRVPFTACGAYELELTKAAAKATWRPVAKEVQA